MPSTLTPATRIDLVFSNSDGKRWVQEDVLPHHLRELAELEEDRHK